MASVKEPVHYKRFKLIDRLYLGLLARKSAKYSSLPSSHIFQPLVLETLGSMYTSGIAFLSELGHRSTSVTGDSREIMYLFQRVSLAVQRYNSMAFKGSFLVTIELD